MDSLAVLPVDVVISDTTLSLPVRLLKMTLNRLRFMVFLYFLDLDLYILESVAEVETKRGLGRSEVFRLLDGLGNECVVLQVAEKFELPSYTDCTTDEGLTEEILGTGTRNMTCINCGIDLVTVGKVHCKLVAGVPATFCGETHVAVKTTHR